MKKPYIKKAIIIAIPVILVFSIIIASALTPSKNKDNSILDGAKLIPQADAAEKPIATDSTFTSLPETEDDAPAETDDTDTPAETTYFCYRFYGNRITADGTDYTFNVFNLWTVEDNDTVASALCDLLYHRSITLDKEHHLCLDGQDIAYTLIRNGVSKALVSEEDADFETYKAAENAAKEERIGIWAEE